RPLTADAGAYLVVECAGHNDPSDALAAAVDGVGAMEAAVATSAARRAELWRYREAHTEAINTLGPPHKLDVTLPAGELAAFTTAVRERVALVLPDAHVWLFGHAADGNLHVN